MPAHFRPYFTLFTARFQLGGYNVHRTTATISRHHCIYAPDIFPFIRFFIRSSFTLMKSHTFFTTYSITRATLKTPANIPATFPATLIHKHAPQSWPNLRDFSRMPDFRISPRPLCEAERHRALQESFCFLYCKAPRTLSHIARNTQGHHTNPGHVVMLRKSFCYEQAHVITQKTNKKERDISAPHCIFSFELVYTLLAFPVLVESRSLLALNA